MPNEADDSPGDALYAQSAAVVAQAHDDSPRRSTGFGVESGQATAEGWHKAMAELKRTMQMLHRSLPARETRLQDISLIAS